MINIQKKIQTIVKHYVPLSVACIVLLIAGLVVSQQRSRYTFSQAELKLVAKTSVDTSKIQETASTITYSHKDETPASPKKSLTVAGMADATNAVPYQAQLSKDPSRGIRFGDSSGELSLKLIPLKGYGKAKLKGGKVVYPSGTNQRQVYTFKRNGLKEDIVLSKAEVDKTIYSWRMELGDKLEAKMLPGGAVGIFSANPLLSGEITTSSAQDMKLLDTARRKGDKTNLVFVLPAPYIKDATGAKNTTDVSFKLEGNLLILEAHNLKKQHYPLSIDPSIVVTTTNDFRSGNDDGMIDFGIDGEVNRSNISLGTVGATTQQTNAFTTARYSHTSVVANGFLYVIGGTDGTLFYNDIQHCPINANGSVGTCVQQNSAFTTQRYGHTSVVYNGFLYIIGGYDGLAAQGDIQYCPLNSDGSVGACVQQNNAFTTPRYAHASVVANGYLYIIGGVGGSYQNDIQHCPINADGSVGTCVQQTAVFTTPRTDLTSVAYNGYIYIIGGISSGLADQNDIQHCPINADGSVGTCVVQAAAFTTVRHAHTSVTANGYLYIIGGKGAALQNDVQNCPINADGSVGTCVQQTAAFTGIRYYHTSVVYNGFLYVIGGTNGTPMNDIQRLLIGSTTPTLAASVQQTNAFTNIRSGHTSVVSNGYLYIIGGENGTKYDDIQHCPINVDGSVGTCVQQTAAFTNGRYGHSSVLANGYVYIIGGDIASGSFQNDILYAWLDPSTGAACLPSNHATCSGTVFTQQTGAFTTARYGHTSVVANGYLLIAGGFGAGAYQNDVQHCLLNVNGSVGTCTQQAAAFTGIRAYHTSVVANGYLYIVGGNGGTYLNDIIHCPVNSDGSVGTCTQQAAAFTTIRSAHTSVIYNGYLYIIGGNTTAGVYQNDIQYCPFNADGSVGACTQKTSAFTTARSWHTSVVFNGNLYIIGGSNGTKQNDIQRIGLTITPASMGSVGSTTQQTNAFTTGRYYHSSVVYNGYLYVIGGLAGASATGCDASGECNDIIHCPINVDGSVGTCIQQLTAFTTPRDSHTSIVNNGYVYIVGGYNGSAQNDIQYAWLDPSTGAACLPSNHATCTGTVFTQQTNAFTTARYNHTSIAYNGYLYIVGGSTTTTLQGDIQHCPLGSDGSVGTCVQQTSAFTSPRYYHSSEVYNGYLYIIGGSATRPGANLQNDIQHCPINSDGSVGTCVQQTAAFTTIRMQHSSAVYNGYLYIIGGKAALSATGCDGTGRCNDIQRCPFNADGSVGTCTQQLTAFTSTRSSHTSVVANGYLYIIGGYVGGYANDIQHLRTNAPSISSRYERTFDVVGTYYTLDSLVINGTAPCGFSLSYATAGSNGVYGAITAVPSVATGSTFAIAASSQRYLRILISLPDDTCGGTSRISDITLNYTIPPPPAPTLTAPSTLSTILNPVFQMRTTSPSSSYLRYKFDVCSNSDCSSILRTIDETASQTGWSGQDQQTSTAYTGNPVITSSTMANHTYQNPALAAGTQYWWRAYAAEPAVGNNWSVASAIVSFTTKAPPAAPILSGPIGNSVTFSAPEFTMQSSDINNDYLQYKIELCSTSNCSSVLQTFDQTASQAGWVAQDASSGTAYVGDSNVTSSSYGRYQYSGSPLTPNVQYWWRAYAIDPAGNNTLSSASAISSFTTSSSVTELRGGTDIRGGTSFY